MIYGKLHSGRKDDKISSDKGERVYELRGQNLWKKEIVNV